MISNKEWDLGMVFGSEVLCFQRTESLEQLRLFSVLSIRNNPWLPCGNDLCADPFLHEWRRPKDFNRAVTSRWSKSWKVLCEEARIHLHPNHSNLLKQREWVVSLSKYLTSVKLHHSFLFSNWCRRDRIENVVYKQIYKGSFSLMQSSIF